jgi:hypothetical protein
LRQRPRFGNETAREIDAAAISDRALQFGLVDVQDDPVRDSMKLQFRAEFFNVLNHPNFSNPLSNIGTAHSRQYSCGSRSGWRFSQTIVNYHSNFTHSKFP